MAAIGEPMIRVDARAKVTGAARYPGDIDLPNQAWMKILFAHRPHARIRAIDVSKAESMPGVLIVLTAKDVPINEYGLLFPDQPVLCGPGSAKPGADCVRFIGDQVAVVVAESEEIAAEACARIAVDYEDLPVVEDPRRAMLPEAELLHPNTSSNVFCHYKVRRGDVDEGFRQAHVIAEADYRTPAQEHAYLQPEAGLGYLDEEGRITVVVAGQWVHEDQEQIAHALGLPVDRVRVVYPAIGGAFGGREDMSVQIVLALAVMRLHERGVDRPIKVMWSREESMIGHHKRHPFFIHAKWGAARDGKIVAARVELIADGGAYIYTSNKVLGNAVLLCTGAYEVPNVSVDGYAVYTNNIPTGAFRGFGGPQGIFAAECQINRLAELLAMDAVEIRMRNVLREGSLMSVGTPIPKGISMEQVLAQCARAAGWEDESGQWRRTGAAVPIANGVGVHLVHAAAVATDTAASLADPMQAAAPSPAAAARAAVSGAAVSRAAVSRRAPARPAVGNAHSRASATHAGAHAANGTKEGPGRTRGAANPVRGTGIAMGFKNIGFSFGFPENCHATIELHGTDRVERVVLHHAGAEVGQGAHTAFAQMTAEAVGVDVSLVELDVSDTASTDNSGSASASRLTFMAGNSIRGAAAEVLRAWNAGDRPAVGHFMYRPPATTPFDPETGHATPNFAYGYVAEAVEVEVDTETGHVKILDVICADDVGKAINPALIEGQIEGAVVQAAGYAVLENFVQKDGKCLTPGLSTYLIPTVLDIPDRVQSLILEYPDPIGPFGARGMAEMPYLPLVPAITQAIRSATGVWIDEFPLTPERVLAALKSRT